MNDRIRVIYKDKNFLALYKPAGVLVHKAESLKLKISEKTLADWLLENYPEVKNVGDFSENLGQENFRPGIVHRLDRNTSGVILVARNQKYFEYLKNLFQAHQIKKTYIALVWGELKSKSGVIKKPISIKSGAIKRTVWKGKIEKEAITEYKVVRFIRLKVDEVNKVDEEKTQIFSLIKAMPKTGRTHQIRIHMASIGHPIVGDSLYGPKKNPFDLGRQFLHAESLEFTTEDGKRIKIEAELPEELKNVIHKQALKIFHCVAL